MGLPDEITVDDTTYSVSVEVVEGEVDDSKVITLTDGATVKLLSPNTTPTELALYADPNNQEYNL